MPGWSFEDLVEPFLHTEFHLLHPKPSKYNPYAWDLADNSTSFEYDEPYDSVAFYSAFHRISHTVSSFIGGIFSFTLLYLILYHCKGALSQYRRMLLLCCMCDLSFWLAETLINVKTKINDGCLLVRLEGMTKYAPYHMQAFFTSLFPMHFSLTITILPAQYLYRYWSVCETKPLTIRETLELYFVSYFFAAIVAVLSFPSFDHSALVRPGFNYGTLWYKERPLPPILIADFGSQIAQAYIVYTLLIFVLSYAISVCLAIKTFRLLAKNNHLYSDRTKLMQSQMTATLLLQSILPLFISVGPAVTVCVGCFFRVDTGVMSLIVMWFASWVPVFNPLLTIWVIRPFRRKALGWICGKKSSLVGPSSSSKENLVLS